MHKRALSTKLIKKRELSPSTPFDSSMFPDVNTSRAGIESRRLKTSQFVREHRMKISCSPVKNFDYLVKRCETELKKIRNISIKLKKSSRKVHHNQELINRIIYKPLYSIKVLSKEKPRFLNRYLKYQ